MTQAHPRADAPDLISLFDHSLFDHRIGAALSTRGDSGVSRAGDAHVVALRTMFDAIHRTMDEYAALLAERGKQLAIDAGETHIDGDRRGSARAAHVAYAAASLRVTRNRETRAGTLASTLAAFVDRIWNGHVGLEGLGAPNAADVCVEMARVADKWLRFAEATALRDARRRTAIEEVAPQSPVLEW